MTSKELGQYFTKNKELQRVVKSLIKNNPKIILEPSIGRGDLIEATKKKGLKFDMFEIDTEIELLKCVDESKVCYGDFLVESKSIEKKYKTIIGNPPYVKTKTGNLYIKFTEICYELLEEGGELIFIVPSEFFKSTRSVEIINKMMEKGSFTDIYHPNDEKLFENASVDVLIYRYLKQPTENIVLYNNEKRYIHNYKGCLIFSKDIHKQKTLGEYFDIYVGMVSGKESVFKCDIGNIRIIVGDNEYEKYILVNEYPSGIKDIDKKLLENKSLLLERKMSKFTDDNWFKWGALRNIRVMEEHKGEECIYIHNLTRKNNVSFKGVIQYYGGNLIMLKPKSILKDPLNLDNIVKYINSDTFKEKYTYSNRFKIGQRQLCNAPISL